MRQLLEAKNQLERSIPGSEATIHTPGGKKYVLLKYNCPCGEVSNVALAILDGEHVRARDIVHTMREALRRHVIKEGFTPTF